MYDTKINSSADGGVTITKVRSALEDQQNLYTKYEKYCTQPSNCTCFYKGILGTLGLVYTI